MNAVDEVLQADGEAEEQRQRRKFDREWVFMFMFRCICVGAVVFATCFLPWSIWVTHSVFKSNHHIDVTPHAKEPVEARELIDRLEAIEEKISQLPPADWRRRIELLETGHRENTAEHSEIITSLEVMKVSLSAIKDKLGVTIPDSGG